MKLIHTFAQVTKVFVLFALFALVASTVHAQSAPCDPYQMGGCAGQFAGPTQTWAMNGELHINTTDARLGWVVVNNLETVQQTARIIFSYPDGRESYEIPLLVQPGKRSQFGLHEDSYHAKGYFSITVLFQGRGNAFAFLASECHIGPDGQAECTHTRDVGGVLVP